jgi:hypothetical protein
VLSDLIREGRMQPEDLQVRFYGPAEPWVNAQVRQYGLDKVVEVNGLVPRKESLQRQAESQLLLLLGWADPRETGQHSGKLFEYLGAARPILAIGGSAGVLTEALNETQAGIHALSKDQARDFLIAAYGEFKAKGYVAYHGQESAINQYTHIQMARQFANVLDSVDVRPRMTAAAAVDISAIASGQSVSVTEPEHSNAAKTSV